MRLDEYAALDATGLASLIAAGEVSALEALDAPVDAMDAEVSSALQRTVDLLSNLGHEVVEGDLGIEQSAIYRMHRLVSAANFAGEMKGVTARVGREPEDHGLDPPARRLLALGR